MKDVEKDYEEVMELVFLIGDFVGLVVIEMFFGVVKSVSNVFMVGLVNVFLGGGKKSS